MFWNSTIYFWPLFPQKRRKSREIDARITLCKQIPQHFKWSHATFLIARLRKDELQIQSKSVVNKIKELHILKYFLFLSFLKEPTKGVNSLMRSERKLVSIYAKIALVMSPQL